jgi:hypothetical protein
MQIWRPQLYTRQVNVRVDPDTVEWLQTKAEAGRLSILGYARKVLIEAAKRDLQPHEADDD